MLIPDSIQPKSASASPSPRGIGLALALVVALSGCFGYVPVLDGDPEPDANVRLRLSSQASAEISAQAGQSIRSVEGTLLQTTPDSLVVDVHWGAIYAGTPFEGRRDTLSFARSDVVEVDRREISRLRTGFVVGGLAAAAVLILRSFTGGGGESGTPGPGPGDPL